MLTLRVHLDDMPDDDAPLLIAPAGPIAGGGGGGGGRATVARCGTIRCVAAAGDIWCYATAILHASAAAHGHRRRRVSQVDYAADALPAGLKWPGI
ncbi:hypothetical protein [Sphingomonas phyllosphaerae]|uniref:hypothetical protein n=1 Tax=Sphingomonas phyllosphaerae TaxID=257003 RepID=UPI0003B55B3D|nr:hypothetical protein [Sphingomonas phyllosphaerae]